MATTKDCLDLSSQVQASTSASNGVHMVGNEGSEENAADVLVKFLMSRHISLDVINDSHFRTLLKSIAQNGQKSCNLLENSTVVQKSLWNFEHKIKQYMQMVVSSWKTTGCSVMSYNLKGRKQNKLILGFYCPKGFIFLEAGPSREAIHNALTDLVPNSTVWNDVIQFLRHDPCYHSECKYQALAHNGTVYFSVNAYETNCVQQQVQVLWRRICQVSKWVQNLIKKSDNVYEYIATSDLYETCYTALKRKGVALAHAVGWKPASSFSRLFMVMNVEFELRKWLSQLNEEQLFHLEIHYDITTVINNSEFWKDGNELIRVLTPFFKIPSLMDTLVPSAGYLELAIGQAKDLLKSFSERHHPLKYNQILDCVDRWRINNFHLIQDVTRYFNPSYILKLDVQEITELRDITILEDLVDQDEVEVLYDEIDVYSIKSRNPFANVSISECEANHPLTLWSKYGGEFPLLQKCANKLLSKPACCLCKQVEKQTIKLGGSDNYLLRLNSLMMEEFAKIGDRIIQPIHCPSYNSQVYLK